MRLLVASLMVSALSSLAVADGPTTRFAQPPPGAAPRVAQAEQADRDIARLPIAPVALDRAKVRAALAANRAANLDRFRAYQAKGVFPSNTYEPRKLNVWLDELGNYCAAATIIRMSGGIALSEQVAEQNNFIRLGDVKSGPVMDWILTSGFTQGEIAAIQEPFMDVRVPVEPTAEPVIAIDNGLRRREDARLRAKYKQVESRIVRSAQLSLEAATDRLMQNPALARTLINS